MSTELAHLLVNLFLIYAATGIVFALAFVWRGVGRIDPVAAEGTWGFKVLIFPGCAALWPLLLRRWISGAQSPPDERNPHRDRVAAEGATPRGLGEAP